MSDAAKLYRSFYEVSPLTESASTLASNGPVESKFSSTLLQHVGRLLLGLYFFLPGLMKVFDLGGTQTFTPESLAAIDRPMMVYGAPAGFEDERLNLDIESRALAAALPEATSIYHEPEDLTHFDFMGECTWMGLSILRIVEPQDAYVCADGRKGRAAQHEMIIDQVDGFFAAATNKSS